MTWDEKCWGIFNNIYWEMRFAGVKGFKLTSQLADQLRERDVPVPKGDGIYVRVDNDADNTKKLLSQEVVLNHFFNIALDIAGDNVVSQLLCGPLGINDAGPFESYDRDFGSKRFCWPEQANVIEFSDWRRTQTGLTHLAGADRQISGAYGLGGAKRRKGGQRGKKERENLGLLFVVPEKVREQHLSKIGVDGPNLPSDFLGRLRPSKLPTRIRRLFEDNPETLDSVRSRVRLASVSWTTLRDQISKIESELDRRSRGDQTLLRLLTGLRTQIEKHGKTGIPRPPDSSS